MFIIKSYIKSSSRRSWNDIIYIVTVTDSNGCVNSDNIEVKLIPEISTPSGFSPNGDGKNDKIKPLGYGIIEIDFRIHDKNNLILLI